MGHYFSLIGRVKMSSSSWVVSSQSGRSFKCKPEEAIVSLTGWGLAYLATLVSYSFSFKWSIQGAA